MSEEPSTSSMISQGRSLVVSALLGGGSLVMMSELVEKNLTLALIAAGVGAVLFYLLPRPIDMRSIVYAFFVPITMAYGAATEQLVMLLLGAGAGVLFFMEHGRRRPETPAS